MSELTAYMSVQRDLFAEKLSTEPEEKREFSEDDARSRVASYGARIVTGDEFYKIMYSLPYDVHPSPQLQRHEIPSMEWRYVEMWSLWRTRDGRLIGVSCNYGNRNNSCYGLLKGL